MGLLETVAFIIFFIFGLLGLIVLAGGYFSEPVSVNVTITPTDTFKDQKNVAVKVGDTILDKTVNIINGAIAGANK
jgi:hypothetical protein